MALGLGFISVGPPDAGSMSRLQICSTEDSVNRRGGARGVDFQSAWREEEDDDEEEEDGLHAECAAMNCPATSFET